MNEIIYPDLSIVIIGHVDHGKTTLAKAITGQWLSKHSEELKRGITIKLGYADFIIYKCDEHGYTTKNICPICNKPTTPIRKISLVDAPGHEALLSVMLSGAALVDAAILVIAANESVPQPQTLEHLIAFKLLGDKPLIVVQNKLDLISKEEAIKNYEEIVKFLEKYNVKNVKIIPISAINELNIKYILEALAEIPKPKRDLKSDPIFLVSRSFDVNKPGTDIDKLTGGVLGGSLIRGKLHVEDEIEISPGLYLNNKWVKIRTKIKNLKIGNIDVDEIIPGGTAGIETYLDPFVTKDDTLVGQMVGYPKKLPGEKMEVSIRYQTIKELYPEEIKIKKGEEIMIGVYNIISLGIVTDSRENEIKVKLTKPVLGESGDKAIIMKKINNRWRIYGYGELL